MTSRSSSILKKIILYTFLVFIILLLWRPLIEKPLWHDEEQIVFAAKQLIKTGQRAYFDGRNIVGENLHHPLNEKWDLEVMSPGEIYLAALGKKMVGDTAQDPWRLARGPIAFLGALSIVLIVGLVTRLTKSKSMGLVALLLIVLTPWVWTLCTQLRYYPVCWLLVVLSLGVWANSGRWHEIVLSALIYALYLFNWTIGPMFLFVLVVMNFFREKQKRAQMGKVLAISVLAMFIHAFFLSTQAQGALKLPSRFTDSLWALRIHLAEFNLDVFPLLLLLIMMVFGWSSQKLKPWLVGCAIVVLSLSIPHVYTRLTLMFLPLFFVTTLLFFNEFVTKKPKLVFIGFVLLTTTHFFHSFPGAVINLFSKRLSQIVMPLNRHFSSMWHNPQKAWHQVFAASQSPVDQLSDLVKQHVKDNEQVICAMDGTGLQRVTGCLMNWKTPQWARGRELPRNLKSPERVKMVVVREQWPYLTREVTWTNEIVQAIKDGWLSAKKITLPMDDLRFTGSYPFPFALDRQAWPEVSKLTVWLLEEPITSKQAQQLMGMEIENVIRPHSVDQKLYPDVVWGYLRE